MDDRQLRELHTRSVEGERAMRETSDLFTRLMTMAARITRGIRPPRVPRFPAWALSLLLVVGGVLVTPMAPPAAHAATIFTLWTQQNPAAGPSARSDAGMAYDAATKQLILFGGS